MKTLSALVPMIILLVACRDATKSPPQAAVRHPSVFEVVIADLVAKEAVGSKFVGSKAMVVSNWNNGDSLFYSLNDELRISDELIEAMKSASGSGEPFPNAEVLGPMAIITTNPPLNYLEYYDDDVEPVQAKCFVSFWRPGYSKDGRHAIVRAWYGPDSHDAIATYLLENSDLGWKVTRANLSVYP